MGVVKKICLFYLVFSALNFSANTTDTIYFSGNKFVEHIVKSGESLRSISDLHEVSALEIINANDLEKRLFYNQLLYIPIYLSNYTQSISAKKTMLEKIDIDTSITNIALLMPYYCVNNDTMFNMDTLDFSNRFYNKSESALSFHIGIELALDSLRKAGINILLHTFDTNQDELVVKQLVYSNQLNEMDIIIGPMYSDLFKILCLRFGDDTSKILISPLSRDSKEIKKFPAAYQIALTYKVQAESLTKYLIENKISERIIIFHDKNELGLSSYLKYKFLQKNKIVESFLITNAKVDSIRKYFIDSQNILLLSKNKAFISTMLGSIGSIDSISTVFSFESITSYDNLDITNLMEVFVHIPNSRSINYSSKYDVNFLRLFESKFNTNVRKYSKEGYDIIMHFCGNTNLYDFMQYKRGYHENILAPIYKYSDYELVPVF